MLAALPLFAGFVPILFDRRRRGFQDWLAHTAVVEAPGPSIADVSRAKRRAIREASRQPPPAMAALTPAPARSGRDGAGAEHAAAEGDGNRS